MDSTRLIINNQDLSTATVESTTEVSGYTVIKAPKGPITPIKIPAGSKSKLQDIFGSVSKEYPDLLEAYTFNSEYDLYISAPYDTNYTTVPVAYVTPEGIFPGKDPIHYNETTEEIVNGTLMDESGLSNLIGGKDHQDILKDIRYPNSIGILNVAQETYGDELNAVKDKAKDDFRDVESIYSIEVNKSTVGDYPEYSGIKTKGEPTSAISRILIDTGLPGTWFDVFTKGNSTTLAEELSNKERIIKIDNSILGTRILNYKLHGTSEPASSKVRGIPLIIKNFKNGDINIFIVTEDFCIQSWQKAPIDDHLNRRTIKKNIPIAGRIYLDNGGELTLGTEIGYLAYYKPDGQNYFTEKYPRICEATVQAATEDEKVEIDNDHISSNTVNFNANNAYIVINGMGFDADDIPDISKITDPEVPVTVYTDRKTFKNNNNAEQYTIVDTLKSLASVDTRQIIRTYYRDIVSNTNIHAVIFAKYPSNRDIKIKFEPFDINSGYTPLTTYGRNLLRMNVQEEGSFRRNVRIEGSLDDNAKNGYNFYMGFNNSPSYKDQEFIFIKVIKPFEEPQDESINIPSAYTPIELLGGGRVLDNDKLNKPVEPSEPNSEETENKPKPPKFLTEDELYDIGWEKAKDEDYSDVDIFFESRRYPVDGNTNISGTFAELGGYHELSGFIFNKTVDPINLSSMKAKLTCSTGDGSKYWNTCNEAIVELNKTKERFISPLTGSKAAMQARIIEHKYGGEAPMYLNKGTPGLGGQLPHPVGASIINLRYKYNKDQQRILDNLNYNPIIKDSTYGVMAVGQKTCKTGSLTDWSYIGHVSSFLNFQKEVRKEVMIPQLGKANNDYYRTLRKQQVENILAKRLQGNNRIWAQGVVDTSTNDGVNDVINRRAKKFVIDVKVKVDIFSEFVELNFTNVDQGMDVI